MYEQVTVRCELGKVRANGDAKNGSVRVPGSGDYLSDAVQARKKEKEYRKREAEWEVIDRGQKGNDKRTRGWFHGAVRATFSMLARRWGKGTGREIRHLGS